MNVVCRVVLAASVLAVATSAVAAPRQQPAGQQPPQQTKPDQQQTQKPEEEQPQKYEETVVVSGSRTEEKLINAPVTMTVITADTIENAPTRNFAELLRSVPGLNLTQVSARDINVTTRGATGTLATGQLALLDGRSLYQDFFGFVMWDFLPVNLNEIKQVEVIRGPASAVWGANAFNGVVNVISKSPREIQGTSVTVGLGTFDRSVERRRRRQRLAGLLQRHARAGDQRSLGVQAVGRRLFAGSRCRGRPGVIPGSPPPGTAYPAFKQHRHDAAEVRRPPRLRLRGRPDAVVLRRRLPAPKASCTPASGPSTSTRARRWATARSISSARGCSANFFTNVLDGNASNLLTRDVNFQPIAFDFKTKTYDFEADQRQYARAAQRPQLRRQLPLQQLRFVARARGRQPHRVRRLRPGRDLPVRPFPLGRRRPHRSLRLPRRLRVLAAHDVHGQADASTMRSGCRTTAPIARRRSSTTSSTSPWSSRSISARSVRRSPAGSIRCRSSRSATRI